MTNKEKKQFILEAHKTFVKYHLYDNKLTIEEIQTNEHDYWLKYSTLFYDSLPKILFKYRKPTKEALQNFEKDEAWFSHPEDFDDTTDSTVNNDIELEIRQYKRNPKKHLKELALAIIISFLEQAGIQIDEKQIDEAFPLFKRDGSLNEIATRLYLQSKHPNESFEPLLQHLKEKFGTTKQTESTLKSLNKLLNTFRGLNDKIRSSVYTFSLAEDGDNQSMWSSMADESRGFCIEYEFPKDTSLGQRMLMNLIPIYYGKKPLIRFFDVIKKGFCSKNKVEGIIDFDDYQTMFLSTFTKDKTYENQKEWRITFDKRFGGNLKDFPFIKSVTLGERIDDKHKNRILKAAKKKKIPVYQRQFNITKSTIKVVRIL